MKINDTAWMGYGEADITPEDSVELVGFYRPDNRSRGVLHPLKLQVMVWRYGEDVPCLITVDSLGFTVELSNVLRDRVAEEIGGRRENVMVCFSHTHSAPNAAVEPSYFDSVCVKSVLAVREAMARWSPALVAWGVGECDIGLNRRGDSDSVDRRLGIMKVVDASTSELKAVLLRVTAHPNILSSDNYLVSSDYFAMTRDMMESKYGCKVLMVQGASGDIRPRFQQDNAEYLEVHCYEAAQAGFSEDYVAKYTEQSRVALERTADSICEGVDAVFGGLDPLPVERVIAKSTFCRCKADVPSIERAAEIVDEAGREAGLDGTNWLNEVRRLIVEGVKSQYSDVEVQFFLIGDGCLCGIANEAMCKIALEAKDQAGSSLLFLNGYTNGCNSYLPTAEEYDKGGFEVLWSNLVYFPYHGRVMPLNRETAETIVGEVVSGWRAF